MITRALILNPVKILLVRTMITIQRVSAMYYMPTSNTYLCNSSRSIGTVGDGSCTGDFSCLNLEGTYNDNHTRVCCLLCYISTQLTFICAIRLSSKGTVGNGSCTADATCNELDGTYNITIQEYLVCKYM